MITGPVLLTERLELRLPTRADIWPMHAIVLDEKTARFLGPSDEPASHFTRFQRNAGSWILHGYGMFMIRLRGEEDIIGNCGIFHSYRGLGPDFDDMPEAGWIVANGHDGKGYASEAMQAVFEWFEREHGLQRIVCMISRGNAPSVRLAEKLGFTPLREAVFDGGDPVVLLERLPK